LHLGEPITTGSLISAHPLVDSFVYRVESRNGGVGLSDEDGLLIFSTTADKIGCHTDGYHNLEPIDTILMLCSRPDPGGGGVTTVAHIDDLIPALDANEISLLSSPVFPTMHGHVAVLEATNGAWTVRFNMAEIERFLNDMGKDLAVTSTHLAAARRLAELSEVSELHAPFSLERGECLVLNNRKVLHGRSQLRASEVRLLYRVWLGTTPRRSEGR
jgi:hypothetical protein